MRALKFIRCDQLSGNQYQLSQGQYWGRLPGSAVRLCAWRLDQAALLSGDGCHSRTVGSLGYIGATVCIIVIALVCIHCMHMLVRSKKVLCRQEGVGYLSYAVCALSERKLEIAHRALRCCRTLLS